MAAVFADNLAEDDEGDWHLDEAVIVANLMTLNGGR